jgi:Ca-activated chloride channel homolog
VRARRASTGALVAIAVGVSAVAMLGMTAKAVIAHESCTSKPLLVNVAVNDDIAPAIQTIAKSFNTQHVSAAGQCVSVEVTEGQSSAVAGQVDGQDSLHGTAAVDAWIPDSSLWVDLARSYPVGATDVQPTGINVALSPIMLVTSQQVAQATGVFAAPASWNLLLPSSFGGPPDDLGLSVDVPDPVDSAVGLATLIQVGRALGPTAMGRAGFTAFVYGTDISEDFDSVQGLEGFVGTLGPPFYRRSLAEASEQAVLAYDRSNPSQPLAARYPTANTSLLGSPELDYPFVLTTTNSALDQAATAFGRYLQTGYAQSVIRYDGFRSADGQADAFPADSGLSSQPLQVAAPASATEVATTLDAWQKLGLGSRILTLIDDSQVMGQSAGVGGLTLEQVLTQTSTLGLPLFPDTTQIGLWEAPGDQSSSLPYRSLVPIGPITGQFGMLTRRGQIQKINQTVTPVDKPLHLYDAILAGFEDLSNTYASNYSNALVVLTAGVDSPGDMSLSSLLTKLHATYNPSRRVEIVIIQLGPGLPGSYAPLKEIAAATDGVAYQILSPSQVGRVFINAIAHGMCVSGCTGP